MTSVNSDDFLYHYNDLTVLIFKTVKFENIDALSSKVYFIWLLEDKIFE
jgi:hypothetical protein